MHRPRQTKETSMIARRTLLKAPLLLLAGAAIQSRANPAPSSIRFIVPGSVGTGADLMGRYMAREVESALKTPVVVENKSGAGGVIGTDFVAKAAPDGATILITSANHYVLPWIYKNLPFDPQNDFAPVASFGSSTLAVVVAPDSPYKSIEDVLAQAKAHEDTLSYSSAGSGTLSHISGALLNAMAGTRMQHLPYKNASQGLIDVSSGAVTLGFLGMAPAMPLIKAGRVKAIAVTSAVRSIYLPEAPAVAESGLAGFDISSPFIALAPRATPPAALRALSDGMAQGADSPAFKSFCAAQGLEPVVRNFAAFSSSMPQEFERWGKLVQLAQATVG
jgi:tripartite-type tricarboxylate transporter receptor subunit TctC